MKKINLPTIVATISWLAMAPAHGQQTGSCFVAPHGAFSTYAPDALALKKLSTVKGSAQHDYVMERYSYESILSTYTTTEKLLRALRLGNDDIALLTPVDCHAFMKQPDSAGFEIVGPTISIPGKN